MPSKLCLVQRFIPKVSPFKTRLRRKSRTGSAHGAWAAPGLPGGPCPFPEPPPHPSWGVPTLRSSMSWRSWMVLVRPGSPAPNPYRSGEPGPSQHPDRQTQY